MQIEREFKCYFIHHRMNKTAKSGHNYQNRKESKSIKQSNLKNEPTMKLIGLPSSMKSALVYVYLLQESLSKGHLQDKAMQEISEDMDNELHKLPTRL